MADVTEIESPLTVAQRSRLLGTAAKDADVDEATGRCFGYLRGPRERAVNLEFRRHGAGDSFALPYAWLGPHYYHPSHGITLVFAGPLSFVMTIRGRHLNTEVDGICLYERGILRQRVTWIAEAAPAPHLAARRDDCADLCIVEEINVRPARTDDELWELLRPYHEHR